MRACDGCTKCCEGTLSFTIRGIPIYAGNPCPLMAPNGCSIHAERPENPCRQFQCAWTVDEDIPLWMKPDQINCIITYRNTIDGEEYVQINETDAKPLDGRVLSWWFRKFVDEGGFNFRWQQNGGWNWVGSHTFIARMNEQKEEV